MMADLVSLQATVSGHVQGVFFRAFVTGYARELGLAGYVGNRPDGTVEVRAEGAKQSLEKLVGYIEVGPPSARVEKVETRWSDYTGNYSGFIVRH